MSAFLKAIAEKNNGQPAAGTSSTSMVTLGGSLERMVSASAASSNALDLYGKNPNGGASGNAHGANPETEAEIRSRTGRTLDSMGASKRFMEDFNDKPLVVYFIVDLTASREATRAAMKAEEKKIAKLVMESGGSHRVICKGIYHKDSTCYAPIPLKTEADVINFFNEEPEAGRTRIGDALDYYRKDKTDALMFLAVLIGDTADGDDDSTLMSISRRLGGESRPVIIAYEQTEDSSSRVFCQEIAPMIAKESGGHSFQLSKEPKELVALLESVKSILSQTPEELRSTMDELTLDPTGRARAGATIFAEGLSAEGFKFLKAQAEGVVLQLPAGSGIVPVGSGTAPTGPR